MTSGLKDFSLEHILFAGKKFAGCNQSGIGLIKGIVLAARSIRKIEGPNFPGCDQYKIAIIDGIFIVGTNCRRKILREQNISPTNKFFHCFKMNSTPGKVVMAIYGVCYYGVCPSTNFSERHHLKEPSYQYKFGGYKIHGPKLGHRNRNRKGGGRGGGGSDSPLSWSDQGGGRGG